ncbi:uncharacterized protein LOC119552944 isoform X1 [Drosophila subpulchrella]|uniref:uncharacterized protein LOC119552944 isoform X1 n=1 Tax=Drosophila subpulchrella TaxID=1486046 RepID=UPI0018A1789A|nr:uncharacterized protein LOC119552944 isoform X1 [Drosophila subpulchrella]XP_037718834.1 uncharacterized protein LOC119552944 isoform X1 [Drosophila subpulchrella]
MWRAQKFCCCISFQIGCAIISFVTFCLCIVHLVEFFRVEEIGVAYDASGTTPLDQRYKKENRDSYSLAHGHLQFPICKNCSHIINVHGTPGFFCDYQDWGVVENSSGAKQNHSECVPKKFMVNRHIENYCCFWSPEVGCSMLIGRQIFDKNIESCEACSLSCAGLKSNLDSNGSNKISEYGYLIPLSLLGLCIRSNDQND